MIRHILGSAIGAIFIATVASAQTAPFAVSRCDPEAITFSNVRLPEAVLANGHPLAAGTYQVRITKDHPSPAAGQSAQAECWVEFVKAGAVAAREIASVISSDEVATVIREPALESGASRVDLLKGGEYLRVWMNGGTANYIVNMPISRTGYKRP